MLAKEANERKQCDPTVIDATVGMLFDEKHGFVCYPSVQAMMKDGVMDTALSYDTILGMDSYHRCIEKWIFGDALSTLQSQFAIASIATPGGSGAISLFLKNESAPIVLLPDIHWEPYQNFIQEQKKQMRVFRFFTQQRTFDFEAFRATCDAVLAEENAISFILNDPCHNPTGYSLSENDYQRLFDYVKAIPSTKQFSILLDVAYIDMANTRFLKQSMFQWQTLPSHIQIYVAFSGSKTFGLYGVRIGALLALCADEQAKTAFLRRNEMTAGSLWSCPSHIGTYWITSLLEDQAKITQFKEELAAYRILLKERKTAFMNATKAIAEAVLPHQEGFFCFVKSKHPYALMEKLQEKKMYVVPCQQGIRIALSSLNQQEAKRLGEQLSLSWEGVENVDESKE